MRNTRSLVRFALIALGLSLATAAAIAQTAHILVPAEKVQWTQAPPILPAGAEIAILEGNPAEKGPITMRLKLPANYEIPAHWHSMAERLTVLSGSFHAGMGDKLDRKATQPMAPGSFVMLPAKMHHFAYTSAPTVVQISLDGPFDLFYVNPADNPQKLTQK